MGKIFCIVGKSAVGKDTLYKKIISKQYPDLVSIVPYTTRPKRSGEADGVDYNFVTEGQLEQFEKNKKVIEKRVYYTTQGKWAYFTRKFDIETDKDYIMIITLDGALKVADVYGRNMVVIVYLVVDDKTRLLRCIERESKQNNPDYEEVCRRFIADQKDFSAEKLREFKNVHYIEMGESLDNCLKRWDEIYEG